MSYHYHVKSIFGKHSNLYIIVLFAEYKGLSLGIIVNKQIVYYDEEAVASQSNMSMAKSCHSFVHYALTDFISSDVRCVFHPVLQYKSKQMVWAHTVIRKYSNPLSVALQHREYSKFYIAMKKLCSEMRPFFTFVYPVSEIAHGTLHVTPIHVHQNNHVSNHWYFSIRFHVAQIFGKWSGQQKCIEINRTCRVLFDRWAVVWWKSVQFGSQSNINANATTEFPSSPRTTLSFTSFIRLFSHVFCPVGYTCKFDSSAI